LGVRESAGLEPGRQGVLMPGARALPLPARHVCSKLPVEALPGPAHVGPGSVAKDRNDRPPTGEHFCDARGSRSVELDVVRGRNAPLSTEGLDEFARPTPAVRGAAELDGGGVVRVPRYTELSPVEQRERIGD